MRKYPGATMRTTVRDLKREAEVRAALDDALASVRDCRLVVIDPVSAYLGGADEYKNAEIREAIGPLSDLAEKHNVYTQILGSMKRFFGWGAGLAAAGDEKN